MTIWLGCFVVAGVRLPCLRAGMQLYPEIHGRVLDRWICRHNYSPLLMYQIFGLQHAPIDARVE